MAPPEGFGQATMMFAVGYLTYLEIFVIHAVCIWCVAYAATVVGGWVLSALALRGLYP